VGFRPLFYSTSTRSGPSPNDFARVETPRRARNLGLTWGELWVEKERPNSRTDSRMHPWKGGGYISARLRLGGLRNFFGQKPRGWHGDRRSKKTPHPGIGLQVLSRRWTRRREFLKRSTPLPHLRCPMEDASRCRVQTVASARSPSRRSGRQTTVMRLTRGHEVLNCRRPEIYRTSTIRHAPPEDCHPPHTRAMDAAPALPERDGRGEWRGRQPLSQRISVSGHNRFRESNGLTLSSRSPLPFH
jgi:hypothetical protein